MNRTLIASLCLLLAAPALAAGQGKKPPPAPGEEVEPPPMPADVVDRSKQAGLIDLNTADQSALESLPGIGPAKALAIIAARPFASVDDLARVKGIGAKTVEKLRPYLRVGAAAPPPAVVAGAMTAAPAAVPARPAGPEDEPPSGKLNLNLAGEKELTNLPGIGPGKAKAIVSRRAEKGPFRSLAEFRDMPGIGDRLYNDLAYFVTVKVDVNAAAEGDLIALGMPAKAAKSVVAARGKRRLKSVAEVLGASGMREAEFASLAPLIYAVP